MIENLTSTVSEHGTMIKLFATLVVIVILDIVSRLLIRKMTILSQKSKTAWDDALIDSVGAPVRWMIWLVGLTAAIEVSGIVPKDVFGMLHTGRILIIVVLFAWFLFRLIDSLGKNLVGRTTFGGATIDQSLVDIVSKLSKLTVVIFTVLIAMQSLGFSLTGLLAFGGIGGLAVGLAAKDMLANFFGGFMIYFDRPFKVGDWVRSPDREIEGIVERIGWRVTLIRNFDSRPLYVPNSSFSCVTIENVTRMSNRRIYELVGIRYQDAGAMNQIVDDVRSYLQSHSGIDQDQTLMVGFTAFSASSLDFFVYCFTRTQSGPQYFQVKQDVLLKILEIVEGHGASCAFPTTTLEIPDPINVVNTKGPN
ncbi:MAG: mechanosensitive ion channel family protein [Gammaproteobacteria bacterium]|nr:mechanosensitive ion channel family protein [Gammaproteobacteria bacterium]MCY4219836.1 mechanosensitive ion channel family protein [Gammaproteobacteria bacterium]MCY4275100.1 mechanosensitive ion channel family protein [Gammaproteobacteria bacterium]